VLKEVQTSKVQVADLVPMTTRSSLKILGWLNTKVERSVRTTWNINWTV
jgi:hypothetical protein